MAITLADFNKIWASSSPLTPYSFTENNYKQGWNFIGSTPPARQMWDFLQKNNDKKMQYLANNYLPLSGGRMTGNISSAESNLILFKTVATGDARVYGGSNTSNGASLVVYGKDDTNRGGRFSLTASDGTNTSALDGNPDGALTWGGYPVPVIGNNAGGHNSVYRGKNLGTSVTATQYAEISAGTFRDLYIGDYWVINSVTWRIAGFDYWYNTGAGSKKCTTHHVVIVPDSPLATCSMNSTNITTGGYVGSDYYTGNNSNTGKATAQTAINNAFGSAHILTHSEYLSNAVNDGIPSAWAYYDSTADLMSEVMVYGHSAYGGSIGGETGVSRTQLPLFALNPMLISSGNYYAWLRNVNSAQAFANVNTAGAAWATYSSYADGVIRPAFGIKE